jgi:hypothetical protein
LDGIGQSISTIQAADKGISSLTKLVEQADSIAQQAADTINNASSEAKITGTVDLSGSEDLTDFATITAGDDFDIITTDDDGGIVTVNVAIAGGTSAKGLAAQITDDFANNENGEIEATVNGNGQLEIRSTTGRAFRIDNLAFGGATASENRAAVQTLGLDQYFGTEADGTGNTNIAATVLPGDTLTSIALYEVGATQFADASTSFLNVRNESNAAIAAGLDNAADHLSVTINDGTTIDIELTDGAGNAVSIQGLIDNINNDASLNEFISASYDETTGQFNIQATSSEVSTVRVGVEGNDGTTRLDLGFGGSGLPAIGATNLQEDISYSFGNAAGELESLQNDYNTVLEQIDQLVGDSDYRGTNLLNGDSLNTFFNEDRSSSLEVEGANFTTAGLGLSTADFSRSVSVTQSINELRTATESIRNYGSTLANNLAVIQTREEFTSDLINELEAGADKLTVADSNEEGAKLLALQTRQQLGVTALSLASQSQQSVLRLF